MDHPSKERLFHVGARGFVSTETKGQRAEMIALADAAKRSSNPVDHWLISWSENEFPTPHEIDGAVKMFLSHLGMHNQPCFYACHGDTHNRHLHIALNRYDAVSERMLEINKGFTREAAHQAIALIADRFGWKPEPNARYVAENGVAVLTRTGRINKEYNQKPLGIAAQKYEATTGYHSAQRNSRKNVLLALTGAYDWQDLHESLERAGASYRPVGTNGAIVEIAGQKLKASSVHRTCTLTHLTKRLGPYEPPLKPFHPKEIVVERFHQAFRADEYKAEREAYERLSKQDKKEVGRRGKICKESMAGSLVPRRPAPDLESWYYSKNEGVFADRWRNRNIAAPLPSFDAIGLYDELKGHVVGDFQPYRCSDGYRYARGPDEPTAFIDSGARILVVELSDEALLAALRLAALRFDGRVAVTGHDEFVQRTYLLAEQNGLGQFITNSDFVARREASESERQQEKLKILQQHADNARAKEEKTRSDNTFRISPQSRLHEQTRPPSDGLRRSGAMANLRTLPQFGMDRGRRLDQSLLQGLSLNNLPAQTATPGNASSLPASGLGEHPDDPGMRRIGQHAIRNEPIKTGSPDVGLKRTADENLPPPAPGARNPIVPPPPGLGTGIFAQAEMLKGLGLKPGDVRSKGPMQPDEKPKVGQEAGNTEKPVMPGQPFAPKPSDFGLERTADGKAAPLHQASPEPAQLPSEPALTMLAQAAGLKGKDTEGRISRSKGPESPPPSKDEIADAIALAHLHKRGRDR